MKNILMITSDYLPAYGGIGIHVDQLCKNLLDLECTIYLLVARLKTKETYEFNSKEKFIINKINNNFTVVEINTDYNMELTDKKVEFLNCLEEKEYFDYLCYNLNNVIFDRTLEYLKIKNIKFDAIHVHDAFLGVGVVWLAKLLQIPLITTMHSTNSERDWFIDNARRYLVNNSNHIVCVSDFIKKEIEKRYNPNCKISTIHNSICINKFIQIKENDIVDKRDKIEFVYCGRLTNVKGIDILLKAMKIIVNNNSDKNIHLSIVGEGEEYEYLKELTAILDIQKNITFTGYLDNKYVRQLYRECYGVILPSRKEAFSTVGLEAMGEGALVIASKVGGFREMIKHKYNGLLFISEQIDQLVECIQLSIDNPFDNMKMKKNAINTVKEKFSWKKNSLKILDIYNTVKCEKKQV